MTLHNLAQCVREDGRPGEAAEYMWRALEIDMVKLEPVEVAVTLDKLGQCVRLVRAELGSHYPFFCVGGVAGDARIVVVGPNLLLVF